MTTETMEIGERETVLVRTVRESDLQPLVRIDAASTGRARQEYFRVLIDRAKRQSTLQMSLAAEVDGRVVGFVIASLYFGQYGIAEPTSSIEAIGVDASARRQRIAHALVRQLFSNLLAIGVTTVRTEVAWTEFDLLGFFRSEGFGPAARLCLEKKLGM